MTQNKNYFELENPLKKAFFVAFFLALLVPLYKYINALEFAHYYDFSLSIDYKIPFIPQTFLIYHSWYVITWLLALYIKNEKDLYLYFTKMFWAKFVALIICIVLPTIAPIRPEITGNTFFDYIARQTFSIDNITCAFPSIHVTLSAISIIYSLKIKNKFFLIYFILIIISTLTTKQHLIMDFLPAIIIAYITDIYFERNKNAYKRIKK